MKKLILITLCLLGTSASAANWDAKQKEVWDVITSSYEAIEKKDITWTDKWVTSDAVVWGNSTPLPRTRKSIKSWEKVMNDDGSKNLISDYSPAAIVVHNDTAVAHYYYSNATENKEGKRKVEHGRCTDILVKDGKSWKFLSWHCASEPSKN
ncbi:YybH family protein [Colwellia sp. MEBiC06753]